MDVSTGGITPSSRMVRYLPLAIIAVWLLAYWPTFEALWQRWIQWDEAVAHGLPVFAIFVYFIYRRLPELTELKSGLWEQLAALCLLFIGSGLWVIFYLISIDILAQLILLPLLLLAFSAVYGLRILTRFALLWPFFLFALPAWDYLNDPLLFLSSEFVGAMVRIAGMPAVIQGNSIFIPYGHILIADGCSGLRYLVIALALGYLVALLNQYRWGKLCITLTIAGILGLITNWIRIFILIVVGYKTEMQSSLMADHEYFGWALFALIGLPALFFAPVVKSSSQRLSDSLPEKPSFTGLVAVVGALAVAPMMSSFLLADGSVPEITPMLAGMGTPRSSTPLLVSAPDADRVEIIYIPDRNLYARVDHYRQTQQGQKLVPYIKRLYDSGQWQPVANETRMLAKKPVEWTVFQKKGSREQVAQLQWMKVGPYHSSSVVQAKLWQIPARLGGYRQFQVVTLQSSCLNRDCDSVQHRLEAMASELLQNEVRPL